MADGAAVSCTPAGQKIDIDMRDGRRGNVSLSLFRRVFNRIREFEIDEIKEKQRLWLFIFFRGIWPMTRRSIGNSCFLIDHNSAK